MKPYAVVLASLATIAISYSVRAEDGWRNESQAGVVVVTGNTETTTLNLAQATLNEFDKNSVKLSGSYLYQKSGEVLSAKSWSLGLRYDRYLSELHSLFLGQTVEGDRFKGIDQRYNTDLGTKYFFMKDETLTWFGEAGYRYTKENAITLSRSLSYARAYSEVEKKWNPTVSTKYWLEALPNFTDSSDWQANTELSLSAALTNLFSVKSAYLLKFDNQVNAPGLVKSDKILTTSLVAKF